MGAVKIKQKHLRIGGSAAAALIIALLIWSPWNSPASLVEDTPPFHAVTPNSKSIEKLGGWQRLTPPDGTVLYIYTDTLNDVPISVSQQVLPASFKNDKQAKLAEVAKGYNATTPLDAGDIKAYIGTSAKGPQSILFIKHDSLVLIKSKQAIPNEIWVAYIKTLR